MNKARYEEKSEACMPLSPNLHTFTNPGFVHWENILLGFYGGLIK